MKIDYSYEGESSVRITGVSAIGNAKETDLAFCSLDGNEAIDAITHCDAGILLCKTELKGKARLSKENQLTVFLDNPRRVFVAFASLLQEASEEGNSGSREFAASTAIISSHATVGTNSRIGAYTMIGPGCVIGDNTKIHDKVVMWENCRVGRNCVIQSGVTLGEDGFAFERHEDNKLSKFPHFRGVVIGNDVEICANTNIARGSLTDTVIGDGTKIDAMVHIAHNVRIGRNCQLTAGTVIGGSAVIGDNCWTGLNSTIKDHTKLGNNVIVGAAACVIHDVQEGDIVAGVPAKSIKHKASGTNAFLMAGQNGFPVK